MLNDISLPLGLHLRELQPQDQAFAETLFFSTRVFLYQMPLPKAQVDLLIKQQFILQQASYGASFPLAETFIIHLFAEPIGKLILNNTSDSLHLIDIAFLPSMRSRGYGSSILRALKHLADQARRPVRLAVDQQNTRAKKLYLNLGFALSESSTTHDILLW
ncbi:MULTISPECIES: GNAT family N-acetyltransferase [Cellvibrio]|jgi:RimJ/RimL family protein N-acetyltransferase|uniref:RimJ/RimL family protein N-acetyltransferase n=1 Tax=Cellvibrio fibrivorans TaxID=126350 RepID=A0ABU1UXU0_9GAMM|nr:GNAT family N-acetyltransferase [Cellvibrio fibrivorans]MDR7089975.1 RimJ/RimL family protein N-acetyltransferase [Cellvibrio fibrivorans]